MCAMTQFREHSKSQVKKFGPDLLSEKSSSNEKGEEKEMKSVYL